MRSPAYREGVYAALQKLGFIQLIDTEDLPDVLQDTKRRQLRELFLLNASAGTPAGGRLLPLDDEFSTYEIPHPR